MKDKPDMWLRFDYPKELIKIASERIAGLFHPNIVKNNSLDKLLVSAYCQGIVDAAESSKEQKA